MGGILFLAHRVPFPPNRGDKIRAHHLLKKLAQIAPVHVGCFAESEEDRAGSIPLSEIARTHQVINRSKPLVLAGLQALAVNKPVSLTAFHSPRLAGWVERTVKEQDIATIVIFSGQMGQYVPAGFQGRVVIDLCDVDSAKFEGYAEAGERVWLNAREGRLLRAEEERLAQHADTTVLISDNEAALFRSRLKMPSKAHVQVMGNGIDAGFFDPAVTAAHPQMSARKGPHFTFTGQMNYPPNETAALWAIRSFLPAIRKTHPEAELHIVGRGPTAKLLAEKGKPGVTIWGEVPDVRPFIAAADCVIAPLMIARGVQNKVLEAMAMAKPVLLTPQAATGIAAQDSEHWLQCEADEAQMAERAAALLSDPDKAAQMGREARTFVLGHHDWGAMLRPLEQWVSATAKEALDAA